MANYQIGDLITFAYSSLGTRANDPNPTVLVLHPSSPRRDKFGRPSPNNFTHGITFKNLSSNEKMLLQMMVSPSVQAKNYTTLQRISPSLINQFNIAMATNIDMVISPESFYSGVIKPMLVTLSPSPYRLYDPDKMTNIRIVNQLSKDAGKPSVFERFKIKATRERKEIDTKTKSVREIIKTSEHAESYINKSMISAILGTDKNVKTKK